jgi:DNA-binding FadR family transcriptional regulator
MTLDALLFDEGNSVEKIAHHSVKDTIAKRFATLIASGALSVGDTLPSERELASTMGVSRETIRSALLILSTKGIVSVVQGARTRVISTDVGALGMSALSGGRVTDYTLDDVHEARLTIEARIAPLVAKRIDADSIDRLTDLIEAQEQTIGDPVRYLITDREFHTVIYRSCGNAVFSDLAATLYSYLLDHRRRVVSEPGAIQRSIGDHRTILAALIARDGEALAKAFGVHERRIYDTTRALLTTSR